MDPKSTPRGLNRREPRDCFNLLFLSRVFLIEWPCTVHYWLTVCSHFKRADPAKLLTTAVVETGCCALSYWLHRSHKQAFPVNPLGHTRNGGQTVTFSCNGKSGSRSNSALAWDGLYRDAAADGGLMIHSPDPGSQQPVEARPGPAKVSSGDEHSAHILFVVGWCDDTLNVRGRWWRFEGWCDEQMFYGCWIFVLNCTERLFYRSKTIMPKLCTIMMSVYFFKNISKTK